MGAAIRSDAVFSSLGSGLECPPMRIAEIRGQLLVTVRISFFGQFNALERLMLCRETEHQPNACGSGKQKQGLDGALNWERCAEISEDSSSGGVAAQEISPSGFAPGQTNATIGVSLQLTMQGRCAGAEWIIWRDAAGCRASGAV